MECTCYFCNEGRFLLNKSIGLPSEDSIIYEDDNIYIVPDIAPLVIGHFLIITKDHLNSFAAVDDNIYKSLEIAKNYLTNFVFKEKDYIFFEHGAVVENSAGSCIDHAHIHALPINKYINVDSYIEKCGFVSSKKVEGDRLTLKSFFDNRQPYIYYELQNSHGWVYSVGTLPHQFFRMMLAYFLPIKYNWKLQYNTSESKSIFHNTLDMAIK